MTDLLDLKVLNHSPFQKIRDSNMAIKSSQAGSLKAKNETYRVAPKSGLSSIFGNTDNSFLDFDIERGPIDQASNMWLKSNIVNNDATNSAKLVIAPYQANRIEVLLNGSPLDTQYADHIWSERILLNDDEHHIQRGINEGYDPATMSHSSKCDIPAGGTETFYLKLDNFITQANVFLPLIKQTLTLRVYFKGGNTQFRSTGASDSTDISLQSCELIVEGVKYKPCITNSVIKQYGKMPHVYRFYKHEYVPIAGRQINTTLTSIPLTEFTGKTPMLTAIVKDNGASGADLYSGFNELTNLHLFDNASRAVGVYQDAEGELFLNNLIPSHFPTSKTAIAGVKLYVWPFAVFPQLAIEAGSASGSQKMESNMQVQIRAGTAGLYDIVFLAYAEYNLVISNGNVTTLQVNK